MMKTIRKTAIVMLLFVYFLTYGVLPQVLAAGKDTPMIVVAHRAGAKVAPENTLAALEQAIRDGAKGLLKEVTLFDIYQGKGIPEGKKSVAFNLVLRADDRSLTGEEADEDVTSILETLGKELGAVLR